MTIVCRHPDHCVNEIRYIVGWVLEEIFGSKVQFEVGRETGFLLELAGEDGSLPLPDVFFAQAATAWLKRETLPQEPLSQIDGMLALYGTNGRIDVFGSLFFLLSRYEEVVVTERDDHDRFPSGASVLTREGLLERAIGNEYIEYLWKLLRLEWPQLQRRPRSFRVLPSHDIDQPSAYWMPWKQRLRRSFRQLRRGQVGGAMSGAWTRLGYGRWISWEKDPADTISWLLETADAHGVKTSFYYIPRKTHRLDLGMPLDHPHVEDQWKRISRAGHELGIHPGYLACERPEEIREGAALMRRQFDNLGVQQEQLGGRQHYLRWKSPGTARAWQDADLDYDSTLGFSDRCGFRCGICYEFPLYDPVARETLNLRERPLVLMDRTVIDSDYMGLGRSDEAVAMMCNLKEECRRFHGDFTVLWHNERFADHRERDMYKALLAA